MRNVPICILHRNISMPVRTHQRPAEFPEPAFSMQHYSVTSDINTIVPSPCFMTLTSPTAINRLRNFLTICQSKLNFEALLFKSFLVSTGYSASVCKEVTIRFPKMAVETSNSDFARFFCVIKTKAGKHKTILSVAFRIQANAFVRSVSVYSNNFRSESAIIS